MIIRRRRESDRGEVDTWIGAATEVRGDIRLEGTLRVDGRLLGSVSGEEVVVIIGKGGFVQGDIRARYVFAGGRVHGDVSASQAIEIFATAEIEGDLEYARITVEDGAMIQGHFRRLDAGGAGSPAAADGGDAPEGDAGPAAAAPEPGGRGR